MEPDKKQKPRILIVDDEPLIIRALTRLLGGKDYEILTAATGREAISILEHNLVEVMLLDVRLPGLSGLEVLRHARQIDPETVVVMMTGHATIKTAVEAMKEGAFEFLTKPFETNELIPLTIGKALEYKRLHEQNRELQGMIYGQTEFKNLVAKSAAMQRILRLVERLSQIDTTVLITGETGTGKEVLARAIHFSGPRRSQKFVPVDCGAISAGVIESELFGHLKGAFTGAAAPSEGLLRMAHKGTVFLDEIGDLPLEMQTKLLRFIQEKEVRPVGGGSATKVDVRVITATNRDLAQMVTEGKFREDLFFRLNVIHLQIPPLRERREDLPLLIQFMLNKHGARLNNKLALSPEAYEHLLHYNWPGNVREVDNVIVRILSLCTGDKIRVEDLPSSLRHLAPPEMSVPDQIPLSLQAYEKLAIERALRSCQGDMDHTARLLKIGKSTLYRKMKSMKISVEALGK